MTNLEKCPHCGREFDAIEPLEKMKKRKMTILSINCGRCKNTFKMLKTGEIFTGQKVISIKKYNEMVGAEK